MTRFILCLAGDSLMLMHHFASPSRGLSQIASALFLALLANASAVDDTQTGANDRAHVLELRLAAINQPTIEQALVVPQLRMKLAATKEKRSWLQKFTNRTQ